MLHKNVVVLVLLVDGRVAFSLLAGILTTLVCFQVFAERIELHVA